MQEELARLAKGAGAVRCKREVDEGLHHEIIFVNDIILPESFVPANQDGEVAEFICLPVADVMRRIEQAPETFSVDAALVVLDCLIRRGYLATEREDYLEVIHALRP